MEDTTTDVRALGRAILASSAAAAVFGIATGLGTGTPAMIRGAWAAPTLFVGGAALAIPPLYVAHSLFGASTTPHAIVDAARDALSRVTTVLLGLAAPAAFFAVTMHTHVATALLVMVVVAVGVAGIALLGRSTAQSDAPALARLARAGWYVFAFALGARLIVAIARGAGIGGGL